ncbi:MAG TPA: urease subunit gamma [Nitrososphaera sp.]|nr:urease subunit gamma [Nitrososphaera sp.]
MARNNDQNRGSCRKRISTVLVKATVKGEPDMAPFTRFFYYYDSTDDEIMENCIQMIKKKLDRNLRINVNEALTIYCHYVVSELRANKKISQIAKDAPRILSSDKVMIGVAETLRRIVFDIIIDSSSSKRVVLNQPIIMGNSSNVNNYFALIDKCLS